MILDRYTKTATHRHRVFRIVDVEGRAPEYPKVKGQINRQ